MITSTVPVVWFAAMLPDPPTIATKSEGAVAPFPPVPLVVFTVNVVSDAREGLSCTLKDRILVPAFPSVVEALLMLNVGFVEIGFGVRVKLSTASPSSLLVLL